MTDLKAVLELVCKYDEEYEANLRRIQAEHEERLSAIDVACERHAKEAMAIYQKRLREAWAYEDRVVCVSKIRKAHEAFLLSNAVAQQGRKVDLQKAYDDHELALHMARQMRQEGIQRAYSTGK